MQERRTLLTSVISDTAQEVTEIGQTGNILYIPMYNQQYSNSEFRTVDNIRLQYVDNNGDIASTNDGKLNITINNDYNPLYISTNPGYILKMDSYFAYCPKIEGYIKLSFKVPIVLKYMEGFNDYPMYIDTEE